MADRTDRDLSRKLGPDLRERLASVPLFSALDPDALDALGGVVLDFEAEPGHVLIQPGFVAAGLFLIEEGTVTLTVHDMQIELGPGEIVGELALLDDRHMHTTRVRTTSIVRGYCISRADFEKLLDTQPMIAIPMLKVLARRLVDMIKHH